MKTGEVAGGLKLAPESSAQLGISLRHPDGFQYFDAVAKLDDALKTPGRTETTVIPIGDKIALEIKATVVPNTAEKAKTADKKAEAAADKR
jgi:hypothetical protein